MAKRDTESMQAKLRKRFNLNAAQAEFVWTWHNRVTTGRDNPSQGSVWLKMENSGVTTPESASTAASRAMKKDNVRDALAWLQIPREKKAKDRRKAALRRWESRATSDIGEYIEVTDLEPDRSEMLHLFDSIKGDKDLFRLLRKKLFAIRMKWDEITPSKRQNIQSIKETATGIELKLEPKPPYEKLLQDAHGWNAAKEVIVRREATDWLRVFMEGVREYDDKEEDQPDIMPGVLVVLGEMGMAE